MHRDHDGRELLLERWPAKGAPGTQKGGREKGERAALTWAWKETFFYVRNVWLSLESRGTLVEQHGGKSVLRMTEWLLKEAIARA